ncbi:DUF177 domain-containing protein [Epibacterium sp. SM1969]|uniref:DUF177 domain-containing protein n=1 Tax=Tritonibacter aquimaris TaxID=2663379 RepID=A0A844AMP6_9RHOB|nr:DUF177 domain-containing protein [Tritonibacter aquimaris]MQY41223.1 DUF177 domain-containing protein [Tritonibacter aquimaris]
MPQSAIFRVADLSQNAPTAFDLRPDDESCQAMAAELGLNDLRKVRFSGEIRAKGKRDWELIATLGATIGQTCVVSLEPMKTRIDEKVSRVFIAHLPEVDGEEVEMPEDDNIEQLGAEIDVFVVMQEALSLEVPEFPRKDGVELGESVFAEPGIKPMRDEDARPFAGLAALKDALSKDE